MRPPSAGAVRDTAAREVTGIATSRQAAITTYTSTLQTKTTKIETRAHFPQALIATEIEVISAIPDASGLSSHVLKPRAYIQRTQVEEHILHHESCVL